MNQQKTQLWLRLPLRLWLRLRLRLGLLGFVWTSICDDLLKAVKAVTTKIQRQELGLRRLYCTKPRETQGTKNRVHFIRSFNSLLQVLTA